MVNTSRMLVRVSPPTRGAIPDTASITNLSVPSLSGQINTGVICSLKRIPGRDLCDAQTFRTTTTCRNSGKKRRQNRSESKP